MASCLPRPSVVRLRAQVSSNVMRWLLSFGSRSLQFQLCPPPPCRTRPSALQQLRAPFTPCKPLGRSSTALAIASHACSVAPRGGFRRRAPSRHVAPHCARQLRSSTSLTSLASAPSPLPPGPPPFWVLQQARASELLAVPGPRAFARAAHNPSLNRTRYGRPPGRRSRLCLSSPAPARRPASARRLPRTLGSTHSAP